MIKNFLSNEFQKNYWNKNKNKRDYDHPVVSVFAKQRLDYIEKYIALNKVSSAFDVGCGDGFATHYMSKKVKDVMGGDLAQYMLDNNPHDKSKLMLIDAQNMHNIKSNRFDLVYTWELLHHVKNPAAAISEMTRISKKYVVIFEPNRTNPLMFGFGLLNRQERGVLRSSKNHLEKLCKNAGLKIINIQYCGRIPPNKTPHFFLRIVKRLPFKASALTGISVAIIAEKSL